MKRAAVFIIFFAVLGFSLAGLYWSQRRAKSPPVSANAILNLAADAQRDLTRVPMHFTRLSDEQEIAIGRELSERYATQQRKLTPEEEALEKYVRRVGGRVAAHAHRQLAYFFYVLPDRNMINAFSLPGGPVYIGEGMLDQMETEDELASILAHEVEHIDHYHCVERVQIEAKLKNANLDLMGQLLRTPLEFWQAGYNKDEEFEADREGVRLAVTSGYSRAWPSSATNTSSTHKAPNKNSPNWPSRASPATSAPIRSRPNASTKSIASSPKSTGRIASNKNPSTSNTKSTTASL
jgi:Zn-dependent protease with chaperone function